MKPTACPFLAAISVSLALATTAGAATRPRYGGTLRIETRVQLAALHPDESPANPAQASLQDKLLRLVFDRMVRLDEHGQPQPMLAQSWESSADHRTWTFRVRPGVKFQDGTPLNAEAVLNAIEAFHSGWHASASGNSVVIDVGASAPDLPIELASVRNSVLRKTDQGPLVGTGPFRLVDWQPGRHALLAAYDDYWAGRPFLAGVEIVMGRTPRDQVIDLALGKADVVEVLPDQVRGVLQSGAKIWSSLPVDLLALFFERKSDQPGANESQASQALALAIDRAALRDVLLQKQGEVAGGLLPQWLSGYAFLFPTAANPSRAQQIWSEVKPARTLTLGYDPADPLAQSVAERIAVNARAVGMRLQASPRFAASAGSAEADVRLLRLRIDSLDPQTALLDLAMPLGIVKTLVLPRPATPELLYGAESTLLSTSPIIPLVYLPETCGLGPRVHDWQVPPAALGAEWRVESVWVEGKTP